ncbi:GNAT family N-acetyltransferase [Oscillochloris sp. ZM17-4]|uniref:GNAT family N-acetyltransferase n=1 Tax=Oscillochloris sp. ZM17-4 TaxID=2866714 RepID=UPI001C7375FC|nr:GNAT family N-acetyltransferase [Oscillochloris sp. ZM17-4]MBX0329254.1 GNAT family N-acetyltransferase [Oscillochloris sp. ZM17-4]
MITIVQTQPAHIPELVEHQKICFPTLKVEDLFGAEHFAAQMRVFPDGQHVALADGRVIGQSSTFRVRGEYVFKQHTFHEIVGEGFFTEHDDAGEWLYGGDMSVHPDFRGRGVSRMLYGARWEVIRRLGLRGIVAGGMLPGYNAHADRMDVDAYVAEVAAGRVVDPTLTSQLRIGFSVRGVLYDHIRAGEMTGHASLLVWEA